MDPVSECYCASLLSLVGRRCFDWFLSSEVKCHIKGLDGEDSQFGAVEMAQWVKHFLFKCDDWSSDP